MFADGLLAKNLNPETNRRVRGGRRGFWGRGGRAVYGWEIGFRVNLPFSGYKERLSNRSRHCEERSDDAISNDVCLMMISRRGAEAAERFRWFRLRFIRLATVPKFGE